MKGDFVTAQIMHGQTNALVKNIMAQMGIDDPEEAIRRMNSREWVVRQLDLLKQVAKTSVSGVKRFCAQDHLKQANVGWMGDSFKELFLDKVEEDVGAGTIVVHCLEKTSLNAPIMAELGERAELQLAHFFELLKAQSKGEEGNLLVDGYVNIAYIRGTNGNLWAVYARWYSDGGDWRVLAYSVEGPRRWRGGDRVLSRDS